MPSTMLPSELERLRRTGNKGAPILMHRGLRRLEFTKMRGVAIVLMVILFDALLWFGLEPIMNFWYEIYRFWINNMGLAADVSYVGIDLFWHNFALPFPDMGTWLPTSSMIWWNLIISVVAFLLAGFLPQRFMPLTYFLRAALLMQMSASVYYLCVPDRDPYPLPDYFVGMFTVGWYFLFLLPITLALVYYIFDFAVWRKFVVTLVALIYFICFMPMQYMLHALIIHEWSTLFTPVLYILFGPLLNVLLLVCFYSFGMTWPTSNNKGMAYQ